MVENQFADELRKKVEKMAEDVKADGQKFSVEVDGAVFINTNALVVFSTAYLMNSIMALVKGDKVASDEQARISITLTTLADQAIKSA